MKKLVLGALFGILAACGGGGKSNVDGKIIITDGGVDGGGGDVCNVLADTGCQANEKCTWVIDLWTGEDATGRVACAPVSATAGALGAACMVGTGGMMPTGSDNCGKGLYCNSGVCKTVCDPNGGAPLCGENLACANYVNTFSNQGEAAKAGVCDPTCDPLRNTVDGSGEANCKGTLDTMITNVPGLPTGYPSRGCYGFWADGGGTKSRWSCAGSGAKEGIQDFVLGTRIFINSCAPGFFPGLSAGTGTMKSICSALCNPADTYMGNVANQGGLKIPNVASTCADRQAVGKDCIYGWFMEVDDAGMVTESKYSNLGVCLDWNKYTSSQTMMPLKKCNLLPMNADPAMDEAYNQGCRPLDAHPLLGGPVSSGLKAEMRHFFRPAFPMTLSAE
ncbi:MAG: hypothetical protein KBG15_09240 [Kofleriaceae bacterium]|nr:hypothetical protein [Kofleriaceae bacterium]